MATIVRTEKRKRGVFGTIIWWAFLVFNAFMGLVMYYAISTSADHAGKAASEAEQAGAAVGGVFASGVILSIWLVGALILGLIVALTRGKVVTIEKVLD